MTEHTPGTWVAKPHQFGGCWWVDTLDGSIQVSMKDDVDEANARFIAAAPDMEKALDGLLRMCFEDLSGEESGAIVEVALAALAKARGE